MYVKRNNIGFYASPLIDRTRLARHAFYGMEGGPDARRALTLKQVHGKKVVIAKGADDCTSLGETEGDALITNIPGLCIGVRTADCLPVLILDPVRHAVAAVHAGWRGAAGGVVSETVLVMKKAFASDPASLVVALGPAIGQCCYAVGEEVFNAFAGRPGGRGLFIKKTGSLMFDLSLSVELELLSLGLRPENISNERVCTMCMPDSFYSYRRNPGEPGRQISAVTLMG